MPQATDELRTKMGIYFGDEVDDSGPSDFLRSKGWKCDKGLWTSPNNYAISEKEWECLDFLIQEWDDAYSAGKQE